MGPLRSGDSLHTATLRRQTQLSPDQNTQGAYEALVAVGGNYEIMAFGLMFGGYYRAFRNASPDLDFDDVNEGIVLARPQVWFGKIAGLAVEGSFQAQQRGAFNTSDGLSQAQPVLATMSRVGVMPFLSPAGRGSYARPHIRLIYLLSFLNDGARSLYPQHDSLGLHPVAHYLGLGAEWWFGSTSYFRD